MRTIIAHVHLFKNAGTSVEHSLQGHYGDAWGSIDTDDPAGAVLQADLVKFLEERPELKAVSSHQLRPPLIDSSVHKFLPIVYLRHPIDRIRSAYEFESRQGSASPSSRAAGTMGFAEWVEFHEGRHSSQCRNLQTMSLTSFRDQSGMPEPLGPAAHLESAKHFVSTLPAFGLVESFETTWQWIIDWLRHYDATFAPEPERANVRRESDESMEARLIALRTDIGGELFAQLEEMNAADLELHAWATARAARWANI